MATLTTQPRKVNKAFYATLYNDELHGVLGQVDGTLYFFGEDGQVLSYEPTMAPWLTILGEVGLAEAQALADRRHGSAPWIATHRQMEVA